MVIDTGISLWRYLAQSQVDSQTHAERCIIFLWIIGQQSPRKQANNCFEVALQNRKAHCRH